MLTCPTRADCAQLGALTMGPPCPCGSTSRAPRLPELRIFRGSLRWAPTSFGGFERWDYTVVFDECLSCVVGGRVCLWPPEEASASTLVVAFVEPDELFDWLQEDERRLGPTVLEPGQGPLRFRRVLQAEGEGASLGIQGGSRGLPARLQT